MLGMQPLPGWQEGSCSMAVCFLASALLWGALSEGGTERVQIGNQVKDTQPLPAQHRVMWETSWESV